MTVVLGDITEACGCAHKEEPVRTSAALQRIRRRQLVRWLRRCRCSEPWQRATCSSDEQPAQ